MKYKLDITQKIIISCIVGLGVLTITSLLCLLKDNKRDYRRSYKNED